MHGNLKIFFFFFIAAIAGTVLHECGHALVAMWHGFHPTVHYMYCSCVSAADREAIEAGTLIHNYDISIRITWGGVLQTVLTGMAGFAGLMVLNRKTTVDAWNGKHLFWIVLTYFHSREIFNSALVFYNLYVLGASSHSDEVRIFKSLGISVEWGTWGLVILSMLILAYTTFVLVKKHRTQLIVFGALGSFSGGFLWLYGIGEYIMP